MSWRQFENIDFGDVFFGLKVRKIGFIIQVLLLQPKYVALKSNRDNPT